MSEPRRDIKVPAAQVWREFRMRYLPMGVFALAAVAAVFLWQKTIVGPTMVGEVEAIQTAVVTPDAGFVTNIFVRPFQIVKAGDPIAEVISTDVRTMSSQVQELRSRIAMSQLEIGSMLSRQRIAFDFQALSLDMVKFRGDLAAAKAELPTLEASLARAERGMKDNVVPYNDYELALLTRDSTKARVAELERLVKEAEDRLADAGASAGLTPFIHPKEGQPLVPATNIVATLSDTSSHLNSQRESLDDFRRPPILLRSPIDGTVGSIIKRAGENVVAGEMIVTIHALQGDRIVAYLRQGMVATPKKGAPVTVRCRSRTREEAVASVEEVGYRFEAITNQALLRPGVTFEMGMPIGVTMPDSLRTILRPGEIVDLAIGN